MNSQSEREKVKKKKKLGNFKPEDPRTPDYLITC